MNLYVYLLAFCSHILPLPTVKVKQSFIYRRNRFYEITRLVVSAGQIQHEETVKIYILAPTVSCSFPHVLKIQQWLHPHLL